MAKFQMGLSDTFDCNLQYNATSGRVSALQVINTSGHDVYAAAHLTNGQTFGQTFGPGTTNLNIPNTLIKLTFDAAGEVTYQGLDSVELRDPASLKAKLGDGGGLVVDDAR